MKFQRQRGRKRDSMTRAARRRSFIGRRQYRSLEWLEGRFLLTASVWTDQADYAFDSTALIGGSGFAAGEPVNLQVVNANGTSGSNGYPQNQPWQVQADGTGSLNATWLVDEPDAVGASF